jgi:hypothetical protein
MLKTFHLGKLAVYVALSFADLFLTYTLLHKTDGAYEGNPIANAWLAAYGWAGLAAFKLVAMLLVTTVAVYVSIYRPQIAGRLLGFACCAVAFVVIYSCWLANAYGMNGRSDGTANMPIFQRVAVVCAPVAQPTPDQSIREARKVHAKVSYPTHLLLAAEGARSRQAVVPASLNQSAKTPIAVRAQMR